MNHVSAPFKDLKTSKVEKNQEKNMIITVEKMDFNFLIDN